MQYNHCFFHNRPFPSCLFPLFQNESWCTTFHTQMSFSCAFVTQKLDICNSLLYGLPQHLLSRLQTIQNTAARVVTHTWKFDHVTPVLKQLHLLPVCYCIVYKILLLIYKLSSQKNSTLLHQ